MKNTRKLQLVIGAVLASSVAMAAEAPAKFYVVPGINTMKADKDWNADNYRIGASLKAGGVLNKDFDVQGGVGLSRSADTGVDYKQTQIGIDGLWMLSRDSLRPFLLAGIGAEYDNLKTSSRQRTEYSPYANIGAGLQWDVAKNVFLQTDVRYVHGFLDSDRWDQKHSRNLLLNVGLGFAFGGAAAPAPKAMPAPTAKPTAAPVVTAAPVATASPVPTAAPTPMPTPVPTAKPAPKFERVTLSASSVFAFGKSTLSNDTAELDKIATALKNAPEIESIQVTGYTDRLGSSKINEVISQQRADAVKAYLVSQGVAAERVVAVGKGSADPVATCENIKKRAELIECLAPNRRIEVEPITIQVKK